MNAVATPPRAPTRVQVFVAWTALVLPIGAWVAHLTTEAALVQYACDRTHVTWIMHAVTAATALVCVACLVVGVIYARRPASATGNGAFRFLGALAATVAFVNLLLIVWEGAYVPFLSQCAR